MPSGFAVSVALIKNEEIRYVGLTKHNDTWIIRDLKDSLFEIGSITKIFTSTLLAHQVVHSKLKLTKPINKSFPYKLNNKIKLTYQDLANHTSGLPRLPSNIFPLIIKNQDNPYAEYSVELLDKYLQEDLKLNKSKNSSYAYSNLGAGLLAYALSNICEEPFENLLEKDIFAKYNMTQTAFDLKTSYSGISGENQPASNWQFNALKGAGGLISSTSDLSKFIIAQFDSTNYGLSLTRQPTHSISTNMSIGLGWHIINPAHSQTKYWHNGATGGFTSSISFRTSNKTSVIILSNISALHKQSMLIDKVCFELLDLLK